MNYCLIFYLLAEIFEDFKLTVVTSIMEWKTTLYRGINLFPLNTQLVFKKKKNIPLRPSQQFQFRRLYIEEQKIYIKGKRGGRRGIVNGLPPPPVSPHLNDFYRETNFSL